MDAFDREQQAFNRSPLDDENLLSGQFSSIEIAMTVIVGAASLGGLGSFARAKSFLSPLSAAGIFVVMAVLQVACFRLSFLPAIAHR